MLNFDFQHEKAACNRVNEKTHYLKVFNRSNMCKKVKNKDGNEICGMGIAYEDNWGDRLIPPRYRCMHKKLLPKKNEKIKGLENSTNLTPYLKNEDSNYNSNNINNRGGKKSKKIRKNKRGKNNKKSLKKC